MAIVTTAKRADFKIIHEKRQIRHFMDFVLVREDYKLAKPHPEPYLTGIKRLGATKEETLVVEDSSRGLNSAVAAGTRAPQSGQEIPAEQVSGGVLARMRPELSVGAALPPPGATSG
jgi:beta-phosphoglucomutase-like phosphatase (HAD superfamily)